MSVSRLLGIAGISVGLVLAAAPASAHHGNAAYDTSKVISVTGTVTKWQFINPHAGIFIKVKDADGNFEEWSGEFQSIQDLYRNFSWNKDTFKPGEEITLFGNPERDGGHSVWTSKVVFPDGTEVNLRSTYE
jgi:Family of unknown function (DUF6152)